MQWIAVTGPMGSGKSTVAGILRQIGFIVLDADQVVHQVLSPGGPALKTVVDEFGTNLLNKDKTLDRRALGRVVFGDPKKLERLEAILHPLVRADVQRRREELEAEGRTAAFYDVPLLFEKKMEKSFDAVLVVSAPENQRHERLMKRSGWTVEEILERSKSQLAPDYKEARADFLIINKGNIQELEAEVREGLRHLGVVIP